MNRRLLAIASLVMSAGVALAQEPPPTVAALVKHWQTSKAFTVAVVETMPDDQFSFKATAPEMSFGEMASHIGDANNFYCSTATGGKPAAKGAVFTKAAVVEHIKESYDTCIAGLQKMTEADLMKTVGSGQRQMTAFEAFLGGFTHAAHHRAQLEVYLRLKSLQPPAYKF
jgi:uncharacterized damage-inducible protein DinB